MNQIHMLLHYWAEAIHMAVHILSRNLTTIIHDMSPFKKMYGWKPSVSYMKIFGCVYYVQAQHNTTTFVLQI